MDNIVVKWVLNRLAEYSTKHGGIVLVAGITGLVFPSLLKLLCFAAIGYGLYNVVKSEKEI